jgi:uncharacterized RDD family membrane protein YckC
MEYEDTRTISTPEGVELALPLAGLGSRFIAVALDTLLEAALIAAIVVLARATLGDTAAGIAATAAALAIVVGYNVLFEVLGGGRTLGKRAAALRVVRDSGVPVGLRASLIRNVLRLLEGIATLYLPAMVSVLATRDNQRLGDLAAGALVVRDPRRAPPVPVVPALDPGEFASWDVAAVDADSLRAVRGFLARRGELAPAARRDLAAQLAEGLRGRVAGAPAGLEDEEFLERLAAAKASVVRPEY